MVESQIIYAILGELFECFVSTRHNSFKHHYLTLRIVFIYLSRHVVVANLTFCMSNALCLLVWILPGLAFWIAATGIVHMGFNNIHTTLALALALALAFDIRIGTDWCCRYVCV